MDNLTVMRLWRTGFIDLHIDLFDLITGFSFEVVLSFKTRIEREKAFDTIWNKRGDVQSLIDWFTLFRSIKPLRGVHAYDRQSN